QEVGGATWKTMLLSALRTYFRRSPIPMRTVFLAAGMLSVIFVFTSFIGRTQLGTSPGQFDWWVQAPIAFLNFFTWALILPLVYGWSLRWSLKGRPIWRPLLIHAGLGLMVCLLHEVWSNILYMIVLDQSGRASFPPEMLHGALLSLPGG